MGIKRDLMKTFLKVIFTVSIIAVMFSFSVRASAEEKNEYIITQEGEEYVLSYSEGEFTTAVMRSNAFFDISEYISTLSVNEVRIVFAGVTLFESVEFYHENLNVSGSLSVSDGSHFTILTGDVKFSELTLTLLDADSHVRIKEGKVTFENSVINADFGSAVVLDYSAGAEFFMKSGSIYSSSEYAVRNEYGTLSVSGGKIHNSLGAAILTRSTLNLSGAAVIEGKNYGVITAAPISLSVGDEKFSGSVSVQYLSEFKEGSISCILYRTERENVKNVKVYDKNGEEKAVTFFEEFDGIKEKNFGAIYLPYSVNFFLGETLIYTEKTLGDKPVSMYAPPEKVGYEFIGWCTDESGDKIYDFAKNVNNSFNLYAKYRLLPPSFELSSFEFVYDGTTHEFGIKSLSHPLLDSAVLGYTWYCNGVRVSGTGPKIKIASVCESGNYKCKIDFNLGQDFVSVTTPEVSVKVNKKTVTPPTISGKYYSGEYQTPDIYSTSVYTVSKSGGVLVGKYPVKLTLNDVENYEFPGGTTVTFLEFEIFTAENFWTEDFVISDVYLGQGSSALASSRFGEVKYKYSAEYDGVYSETFPTEPGIYYCIATVEGTENYTKLESLPKKFSVIEEKITGISIYTMPEKCSYVAFEVFIKNGLSLLVDYNSSRTEVIAADKISVAYQSAENIRYGDSAVTVSYLGVSVSVPITVEKAEYDVSGIVFEDTETVFNGEKQSISYGGALPMGLDGIPLQCTVLGEGKNSGVYTVLLVFSTASKNYKIPDTVEAELTVLPYESTVVYSDTYFIYDGKIKCPAAYYTDIYGRKVTLEVSGASSLAGEYTALAKNTDGNYKLLGASVTYKIAKADYDFSGIFWNGGGYVYDGYEKSVSLHGLPLGVSVIGYSDSKGTDAGEYLAKAILSYDENNYNPPPEITFIWKIEKADYDLSLFSFSDSEYVFSGKEHFPTFSGNMPLGADGIALDYFFDRGVTHVSEGKTEVKIIFTTESGNYNVPESGSFYVTVLPKGVAVTWNYLEFVYDTSQHAPYAAAAECPVSVIGAKIDAGIYTATAVSLNPDYYIVNSTAEFVINKATNFWTSKLKAEDIFEGDTPFPNAESFAGEIVYIYYSDANGENKIDIPTKCGKYYVVAHTDGNGNYGPLTSSPVSFEVKKILPVAMTVKMNRTEFCAFEKIVESDLSVIIENNNGTFMRVDVKDLDISYQTADTFRFNDGYVKISYLDFSETVSLSVKKADYDMSGAYWSESVFVYDGSEKTVTLAGLPEGVSVLSYSGNKGIYAGEYVASARLDYDSYNYNPPTVPKGNFTVKKQVVTLPTLDDVVYNGKEQIPNTFPSELYSADFIKGVDVGEYSATLKLYDCENYEFSDGGTESVIYYKILPLEITLEISDVDKYLLSPIPTPSYSIVSGEVIEGDDLGLVFSYGRGEVSCTSDNPNYSVSVIAGKINNKNTLSKDTAFLFFLVFLIIVTLILLTVILVVRREDIAHYISVIKCRISPVAKSVGNSNLPGEETIKEEVKIEEIVLNSDVMAALSVNQERADSLITDSLAKNLVKKEDVKVFTDGTKKRIINVDTLSKNFNAGESIDVNVLKENSLIPYDTAYIKVLARGMIDKPLKVYANDFSLSAVKMLALTGGEAIRVITVKKKKKNTVDTTDKFPENT